MFTAALRVKQQATQWAQGLFLGWWVLSGSLLLQVLNAAVLMQSYGAYVAVMQSDFAWNKTAFAIGFSLQQLGAGLLGPVQGWLIMRFGTRLIIRIGLFILAVGFILFSQVTSLFTFYAVILIMAFGSSLSGFISLNTVVVQWFERKRSTMLALMQTGISVGGLLVPLVVWALTTYGWRATVFGIGILILVIGYPLTSLIHNDPETYDLQPYGSGNKDDKGISRDFTVNEAVRTRAFWFISFGHALALTVVSAVLVHLVVYLTEDLGFSLAFSARIIAIMTVLTITGQLLGGILGERFNQRLIATIAMFGHAAGLLMLALGGSLIWVLGFTVIHGISWGLRGPIMQAMRADYFGRRAYAQIMGYSAVIVTLGMMSGPIIAGSMADVFGNYRVGFMILAGLAMLGSVFFVFATKPEPLLRNE